MQDVGSDIVSVLNLNRGRSASLERRRELLSDIAADLKNALL